MKSIEILGAEQYIGTALDFIKTELEKRNINKKIANEAMLIYEETLINIVDIVPDEQLITVKFVNTLGKYAIKVIFPGKEYSIENSGCEYTKSILDHFDDKVDTKYISGLNTLTILVKQSNNTGTMVNLIAIASAALTYGILRIFLDGDTIMNFSMNYVSSICQLFMNVVTMISAPLTFINVIANFMRCANISDRNLKIKKIIASFAFTSAISLTAAYLGFLIYENLIPDSFLSRFFRQYVISGNFNMWSLENFIEGAFPNSIIEPFVSTSPLPIMFIAVVFGIALCLMQRNRNRIYSVVLDIEEMMAKVSSLIFAIFPFILYCAVFELLAIDILGALAILGIMICGIVISALLLFVFYVIYLRCNGIKIKEFILEYKRLFKENIRIGSAADSVLYNVRYFRAHIDRPRTYLLDITQLSAHINLDGSCLVLFSLILTTTCFTSVRFSLGTAIGLAVIIFILSIGAPAQSGGIIIGITLIASICSVNLNDTVMLLLIVMEALFGTACFQLNIVGGIVSIVSDCAQNSKNKLKEHKAEDKQ